MECIRRVFVAFLTRFISKMSSLWCVSIYIREHPYFADLRNVELPNHLSSDIIDFRDTLSRKFQSFPVDSKFISGCLRLNILPTQLRYFELRLFRNFDICNHDAKMEDVSLMEKRTVISSGQARWVYYPSQ
ncbi:unnamed protein product [Ambrosiozyma monospora]|uniref:Unnamed protein product n=1 Tax=Ambrosiozyma monospora TaxID=43982 RepID=A0ACB5SRA6_AMBMO|nr:unnamed protein product [Ambrosiozyma monospora]